MQKLVFPMRETMPQFVCSLRQVDEWKRFQAKQSHVFTQAAYDVHAKYVKSAFARSLKIDDVLRFLDDTALDMDFMVQLPSIEKCLDQWWTLYAQDRPVLDADRVRQGYYDLADVLVQAKTENIHKNSVSMIMRAAWTKWSPKEAPLSQREYFRLLFVLAHLMTETNRLGDYVTFLQETLAKITRVYQAKARRSESRQRKPRVHRKSSVVEILGKAGVVRMHMGSVSSPSPRNPSDAAGGGASAANSDPEGGRGGRGDGNVSGGSFAEASEGSGGHGVVNVTLQRVRVSSQYTGLGMQDYGDELCADQFVEVLDRRGVFGQRGAAQHVVVDPLLHERQFQDKWRRPAHARTLSMEDTLRELHPATNKYVPPLCIARLYTSPPSGPGVRGLLASRQCQSTPALQLKTMATPLQDDAELKRVDAELKSVSAAATRDDGDRREDEVLRRSLSVVTLRKRIERNKSDATRRHHEAAAAANGRRDEGEQPPVYLAIST